MQPAAASGGSRLVDRASGVFCIALGASSAIYAFGWIPIGTARNMGPGLFPLILSIALVVLGVFIWFQAEARDEPFPMPSWRGLGTVLAAPLAFVLTLEPLGFPIAVFAMAAIAATASRDIRPIEVVLLALGMSAFAVALFWYGLSVQVDLVGSLFKGV